MLGQHKTSFFSGGLHRAFKIAPRAFKIPESPRLSGFSQTFSKRAMALSVCRVCAQGEPQKANSRELSWPLPAPSQGTTDWSGSPQEGLKLRAHLMPGWDPPLTPNVGGGTSK